MAWQRLVHFQIVGTKLRNPDNLRLDEVQIVYQLHLQKHLSPKTTISVFPIGSKLHTTPQLPPLGSPLWWQVLQASED